MEILGICFTFIGIAFVIIGIFKEDTNMLIIGSLLILLNK